MKFQNVRYLLYYKIYDFLLNHQILRRLFFNIFNIFIDFFWYIVYIFLNFIDFYCFSEFVFKNFSTFQIALFYEFFNDSIFNETAHWILIEMPHYNSFISHSLSKYDIFKFTWLLSLTWISNVYRDVKFWGDIQHFMQTFYWNIMFRDIFQLWGGPLKSLWF